MGPTLDENQLSRINNDLYVHIIAVGMREVNLLRSGIKPVNIRQRVSLNINKVTFIEA